MKNNNKITVKITPRTVVKGIKFLGVSAGQFAAEMAMLNGVGTAVSAYANENVAVKQNGLFGEKFVSITGEKLKKKDGQSRQFIYGSKSTAMEVTNTASGLLAAGGTAGIIGAGTIVNSLGDVVIDKVADHINSKRMAKMVDAVEVDEEESEEAIDETA